MCQSRLFGRIRPLFTSLVVAAVFSTSVLAIPVSASAQEAAAHGMWTAAAGVSAPLGSATWGFSWDSTIDFLRQTFGSKRRMIQLATIGVCVGLYIMFRSNNKN